MSHFIFLGKCWIVSLVVLLLFFEGSVCAQTFPFTNHTEVGLLQSNQKFGRHASFSFQTFNGVKANKWLRLGFTTGLDTYHQTEIIPIALGARGILSENGKFLPLAGLDIGIGAALFEKDSRTHWTEGGFLLNPSLGILMKTKEKARISLTVGYKRQVISEYQGVLDPGNNISNNSLPPGYRSIHKNRFIFNRASIKMGVFF
ncbi:hypothetical protein GCM10028791_13530 [Echinicola sediminis]